MTKEKMLEAIYEKIADKTLSFGCKIKYEGKIKTISNAEWYNEKIEKNGGKLFRIYSSSFGLLEEYEIIGHPVMIGDIFDYIENNKEVCKDDELKDLAIDILRLWKEKRKPIEEQSIKCIEYIYNLIK